MEQSARSQLLSSESSIALILELQDKLKKQFGITPKFGAELEFYLEPYDQFSIPEVIEKLEEKGVNILKERGWNQYEWSSRVYLSPLAISEKVMDVKNATIVCSRSSGVRAIFAAKPYENDYGSALQLNISLCDQNGNNIFSDGAYGDNLFISQSIAGLLSISSEGVAMLCRTENDYKRFTPHFMAPTHISWGGNNRTTLIRIPDSLPEDRRIEYRLAPSDADPHILVFLVLYGVYLGLTEKLELPERIYGNAFDPSYNLQSLPKTLDEAEKLFHTGRKIATFIDETIKLKK